MLTSQPRPLLLSLLMPHVLPPQLPAHPLLPWVEVGGLVKSQLVLIRIYQAPLPVWTRGNSLLTMNKKKKKKRKRVVDTKNEDVVQE